MTSKFIGLLLIALFMVGCNAATPLPPTLAPTSTPLPGSLAATNPPDTQTAPVASGIVPAWLGYKLTDARTAKPFTLGDYKGKTVYVALLTTGCANCRIQLSNLKLAIGKLGKDKYGTVGLSVEPASMISFIRA